MVLNAPSKICVLYNNKCVETFKACEDYKGNNHNICESIISISYKDEFYFIRYSEKCIYEDNICKTKLKNCDEFIFMKELSLKENEEIYEDLNTTDKNKKCFSYINRCIESYSKCDYNQTAQKEVCESIISEDYLSSKCVFDETITKSITEVKPCSSFQIEQFKYNCEILGLYNNKQCIYSDGNSEEKATENITLNTEDTEGICYYFGGKNHILKLFLIIYCLLIL